MTEKSSPSVVKIAFGVAGGIILAAVLGFVILTGIGAAAARADEAKRAADWKVVAECRPEAIRRAKTMAEAVQLSKPCDIVEEAYRQKWGSLNP